MNNVLGRNFEDHVTPFVLKNSYLLPLALSIAVLFLSGCVSAPMTRVVTPASLKAGTSKLVIYRESATPAMFAEPSVLINDADAGKLYNNSAIEVPIEPGIYRLTFIGNAINWYFPARHIAVDVPPNSIKYVRLSVFDTKIAPKSTAIVTGGVPVIIPTNVGDTIGIEVSERSTNEAEPVVAKMKR